MRGRTFDKPFFIILISLVFVGFLIFLSASMGMHARDSVNFGSLVLRQVIFGLCFGFLALAITYRIPYTRWKSVAFYLCIASLFLTALVFIPALSFEHNSARRWVSLFGFTFQPAEFLKIAVVLYYAALLSATRDKIKQFSVGAMPYIALMSVVGGLLMLQPDGGTTLVIGITTLAMFVVAGGRIRDVLIIILIGIIAATLIVTVKPYIKARIATFLNPSDTQGAAYQINQSLLAIGSGQIAGRGFGQSVQKFNYLPEPIGDAVFAVAAEEFGFIGSLILLALFASLGIRGMYIAARAPDYFGGLVAFGLVILILVQSSINIASMLAIFPLTGMPLLFVSHGGTALMVTLGAMGIVLNISKHTRLL